MSTMLLAAFALGLFAFFMWRGQQTKKKALVAIKEGMVFLEENQTKEGVLSFDSGLQMQVLEQGDGDQHPSATDQVTVHYHGTLLDGRVFDSSVDRGQPISFGLNQVIPGWTEGVQKMVVGEKARLFIPSHLAYGNRQAGIIEPGSLLVFDVQLLGINQ